MNNKNLSFFNTLLLRCPMLPMHIICDDKNIVHDSNHPAYFILKNSIYLASYDLYNAIYTTEQSTNRKQQKAWDSLYRYIRKISTACTPFGYSASITPLTWGTQSHIRLGQIAKRVNIDLSVYMKLIAFLESDERLKDQLYYYVNDSIYNIGDQLRFYSISRSSQKWHYFLNEAPGNKYLAKIINCKGKFKLAEWAELITDEEVSADEAITFVRELASASILVSSLNPHVTGAELPEQILEAIKHTDTPYKDHISTIQKKIHQSFNKNETLIDACQNIVSSFNNLFPLDTEEKNFFNVESYRDANQNSNTLSINIQEQLATATQLLEQLHIEPEHLYIERFKQEFTERFGYEMKPLATVLDKDAGISYLPDSEEESTAFLHHFNLQLWNAGLAADARKINAEQYQPIIHWLNQQAADAQIQDTYTIDLTKSNIPAPQKSEKTFPPTFSVLFRIIDENTETVQVEAISGTTGTKLINRFGYGSPEVSRLSKEITAYEETYYNDEIILAEIVHYGSGRENNIKSTPNQRKFVLRVIGGSPEQDKETVLQLSDLQVTVRENKIFLFSQSHRKLVLPVMSNAFLPELIKIPIYRFLADIHAQFYYRNLNFTWSVIPVANHVPFLPRIIYKNIILSPATWRLKKALFETLGQTALNATDIALFRKENKLTEVACYNIFIAGGAEIFINFEEHKSVKNFLKLIEKQPSDSIIICKEFLKSVQYSLVQDLDNNVFNNQFVALIKHENRNKTLDKAVKYFTQRPVILNKSPEQFDFLSEWLFLKIYCSPSSANQLITRVIYPFIETCKKDGLVDGWFFIKYKDPKYHIRLRIQQREAQKMIKLLQKMMLLKGALKYPLVHKFHTDSYKPEYERYLNCITETEKFFAADSEFISCLLSIIETHEGENDLEWVSAIFVGISLLNCCYDNTNDMIVFINQLRDDFNQEHKLEKKQINQLEKRFKQLKPFIKHYIDEERLLDYLDKEQREKHSKWQKEATILGQNLGSAEKGLSATTRHNIISSVIHMSLNRLFSSHHRAQEMLLHNIIFFYYKHKFKLYENS